MVSISTPVPSAALVRLSAWKMRNLRISDFDGASCPVYDWLNHFSSAVEAGKLLHGAKWPTQVLYQVMASALTGKAATWFGRTMLRVAEDERMVEVLAEHLRAKYSWRESPSQIFNAVMNLKKIAIKTFEELADAFEGFELGSRLVAEQYVEAFINGAPRSCARPGGTCVGDADRGGRKGTQGGRQRRSHK